MEEFSFLLVRMQLFLMHNKLIVKICYNAKPNLNENNADGQERDGDKQLVKYMLHEEKI